MPDRTTDKGPGSGRDSKTGEDENFADVMGDVAPLPATRRRKDEQLSAATPRTKALTPAQQERRNAALGLTRTPVVDPNPLTLAEVTLCAPRDVLGWKKDGVQHAVFQRLSGGHYPVDGSLDLHRHTVKEARVAVFRFFQQAEAKAWRTVLIAHGRGENSPTPARIKSYLAHWLGQLPQVIAYHSADRRHGGTGAVFVLLKKSARAKELTREQFGKKSDLEDLD